MPGRIMSAQQAKKEYGKDFKSIKKSGSNITLKNSAGKKVSVSKNTKVYHRGHGDFGIYSHAEDNDRYNPRSLHNRKGEGRVGKGSYRHTRN